MAAIGAKLRQGQIELLEELQLLGNDAESNGAFLLTGAAMGAGDDILEQTIRILRPIRQIVDLLGYRVIPLRLFVPTQTFPLGFCPGLRKCLMRLGDIIRERRELGREKLAVAVNPAQSVRV